MDFNKALGTLSNIEGIHVQLPTGRQVHDIGKSEAGIWPCILMYLNHLEEAQTILA